MPVIKLEEQDQYYIGPLLTDCLEVPLGHEKLRARGGPGRTSLAPLSPVEFFNSTVASGSLANEDTPLMTPPAFSFGVDWTEGGVDGSSTLVNGGERHQQQSSQQNNKTSGSWAETSLFEADPITGEETLFESVEPMVTSSSSSLLQAKQEPVTFNPLSDQLRDFLINGSNGIPLDYNKLATLSLKTPVSDFTLYAQTPPSPPHISQHILSSLKSPTSSSSTHNSCPSATDLESSLPLSLSSSASSISSSSSSSYWNFNKSSADITEPPRDESQGSTETSQNQNQTKTSSSEHTTENTESKESSEEESKDKNSGSSSSSSSSSVSSQWPPSTSQPRSKEEKALWKRMRNTEAARRSRARKTERLGELEEKCKVLGQRNNELEMEVFNLRLMLATGQTSLPSNGFNRTN